LEFAIAIFSGMIDILCLWYCTIVCTFLEMPNFRSWIFWIRRHVRSDNFFWICRHGWKV